MKMKRKLILLAALSVFASCKRRQMEKNDKEKKLNLLFVLTDEQRHDTFGPYGNHKVKAPTLNKLGKESVVFERAYVCQPVSSPARGTIMTGLYPHSHGVRANNIPLDEEVQTLMEMVGDDYTKAYIGKWHLGRELDTWHGMDLRIGTEDMYTVRDTTNNSAYHDYLIEQGFEPNYPAYSFFSRGYCTTLPIEHTKPEFMARQAIHFLESHKDKPFVLYLAYLEPHTPVNGPLNELHDTSLVELPPTVDMDMPEDFPWFYKIIAESDKKAWEKKTFSGRKDQIRKYWGLVSQVDRSLAKVLDKLDELGLSDQTIIVYTSEHGRQLGEYGIEEKTVMFESSVRVPLMIKVPGMPPLRIPERVGQIDLVPTLLELMGQERPAYLQGESLVAAMKGKEKPQKPVFIEWNPHQGKKYGCIEGLTEDECQSYTQGTWRAVITQDGWKLVQSCGNVDNSMLFNLNDDPREQSNLYYKEQYSLQKNRLIELLKEWQKTVADTVPLLQ